jgi:predicted transcriptional regulator
MLGPLESEVMDVLWSAVELNVHEVTAKLARPLAYTTVMTTLDRLYKKGLLDRRKVDRAFVYRPRQSRSEWEGRRAGNLVASILSQPQASGPLLISHLVEAVGQHDPALLDELERRIRHKRRELERRPRP